jgi:hypothetical protein
MALSRRRLLRGALGTTALGLAGCLDAANGLTADGSPVTSRTTTTPTTTDDADCTGYEPLPGTFDVVEYGTLGDFALSVEPETVATGDEFTVRLRNTADGEAMTGNRRKFDVQRDADDGWTTVYRVEGRMLWTDEGVVHQSGEGFTWDLSATRDGLAPADSAYRVCDPVQPGSYRFVYWGVTPPAEEESDFETDYAIGAKFEVEAQLPVTRQLARRADREPFGLDVRRETPVVAEPARLHALAALALRDVDRVVALHVAAAVRAVRGHGGR